MTPRPVLLLLLLLLGLVGCSSQIRDTTTARTSTEMLLLSSAAERAIARLDTSTFTGQRVLLHTGYLACIDRPFVVSCLRAHLVRSGAVLVDDLEEADAVLEVRCGTLAIWEGSFTLGIPSLPVGWTNLVVQTPPFGFGYDSMQGWALLEAYATDPRTGHVLWVSDPLWGRSRQDLFGSVYPDGILDRLTSGATRQALKLGDAVDPDAVAEPPPAWPAPLVRPD